MTIQYVIKFKEIGDDATPVKLYFTAGVLDAKDPCQVDEQMRKYLG